MPFFPEDIVEHLDGSGLGIVARTWSEQPFDTPVDPVDDPLMRPLAKGEVGVQDQFTGVRRIVSDITLKLVDRSLFVRGDICKRTQSEDSQSGVVLNIHVQVQVRHAITNLSVDNWFEKEEFRSHQPLLLGDYVLCDDWIGQVEEVFNEALMVSPTAQMQPIYELGGRFSVGDKCFPLPEPEQHAEKPKEPTDIIVKVTPVAAAISWSAVNQSLDPAEAQHIARPKRFWSATELSKLSIMRGRGPVAGTIGERVVFKDPSRAVALGILPVIYSESDSKNQITVDALMITNTRTRVEVLWQDGTKIWMPATELAPNLSADDYECWPGDFVLWKSEEEKAVAVVQSVSFKDRIASVRWFGTQDIETLPVLELDPLGSSMVDERQLCVFGLRRGEHVLLHKLGAKNGLSPPLVPKVGELEEWVHEMPSRASDGTMEGWRGELTNEAIKTLGFDLSRKTSIGPISSVQVNGDLVGQLVDVLASGEPGKLEVSSTGGADGVDWFGEVVDLTLNGDIVVEFPSSERIVVPIERCSLYRDSDDDQWDGEVPMGGPLEANGSIEGELDDAINMDAWEYVEDDEPNDWGYMETDDDSSGENRQSFAKMTMPGAWPSSPPVIAHALLPQEGANPGLDESESLSKGSRSMDLEQPPFPPQAVDQEEESGVQWNRFEVLPQAPVDHAFYSVEPVQPSKSFMARLAKEYRALESSLPDSILVRTYEDRADLLRSLIIGPSNTPYEDAPFVIDWRLDASFPQTPPIAHFLSWTNETFTKKENRLYSEKAYVLSRGFVRRALEIPLQNLEDDIAWFYYKQGNLAKVIRDSNALVTRSLEDEAHTDTTDAAIPRLSAGGILSLKRTLSKLQQLLDARK
ncbi:hypothetical protein FRC17_009109 [Serendipita sp. 399]|nr:hypothetical protein FRC17_009109 [Serendipita sp. 399]